MARATGGCGGGMARAPASWHWEQGRGGGWEMDREIEGWGEKVGHAKRFHLAVANPL